MITGVGAIMGYGLLNSIRNARPNIRLVGVDIYNDAIGQVWCDAFEQAPYTSSPEYAEWLYDVVDRHNIDLIIPGIEQDVHRLAMDKSFLNNLKCKVALNDIDLICLTQDKWDMHQALLMYGDDSRIPSFLHGNYNELADKLGTPFILKPRCGYASKGIVRINTAEQFAPYASLLGEVLMAQPIVGTDDEEYTVAVFGDGLGDISCSITLQRRLAQDGSTAKGWVRQEPTLDLVVKRLCNHFKPLGPTNLQFRRDKNSWKLLEINPRISSTSSMRTAFGYNEGLMCLDYYLEGKLPSQPKIKAGHAIRYIKDYVTYDRDNF